ncbi:MAG: SpoIIE family protein phosphatase [Silvanigrellaceae bacterium]|nr:SpoIIE family protein phosphatase [Silvanigrellaceae bacterium]
MSTDEIKNSIKINTIVYQWKKSLYSFNKFLLYIFAFSTIILSLNLFTNDFKLVFTLFLIICLVNVFTIFKTHRIVTFLVKRWEDEMSLPVTRLMQTIDLISMQKLELLPEEHSQSFTAEPQQRLLEIAREILEHQRFVDRVVDNMFEMMFLINPDGIILKVNKSASESTKYQVNELVGQHIRKLFPHAESLVDYYLELEIQFTTQGIVKDMEIYVQTSEGELIPFSFNGVKVETSSGDLLGFTLIAKNQSETVRLISQLNKSNYELGLVNEELAKRYDLVKKEIEQKEGQRKLLEHELATSQLVQKTFLPQCAPHHKSIECAGTAFPATFCGGDWWNTISIPDKFYVFIGDVTGHGTASAMVTAAISGYFISIKQAIKSGEEFDVDDILKGFDRVLLEMASDDVNYHMTCFSCIFDLRKKVIRFANAGHNFPMLVHDNKKMDALIVEGERLGSNRESKFRKLEVPYVGGEFLLFYTDGLIENQNQNGDSYGKKRLRKFVETHQEKNCSEFVDVLLKDSLEFYGPGKSLEDDLTIVAVRIKK